MMRKRVEQFNSRLSSVLFPFKGMEHQLQAGAHCQDHSPQIALVPIVAAAFIESREKGSQGVLMQPEEVVFSWLSDQFLIEGQGNDLTVRQVRSETRPLQGLLGHG